MQKRLFIATAFAAALVATSASAGGKHGGGHEDEVAIGKAGKAATADRTIEITMLETEDGDMLFEPSKIEVKKGETIRFVIANDGVLEHEFVMDTSEGVQEHKLLMEKFPEMEHADPNAIRLPAEEAGEIVWTFTKAGDFQFACLIPGHYDMGMHGPLTVASR
ncbi:cupredoxin family protein [Aurantimonas sp. C2-6-R+9]|uniref:Copper oxidase n=2 Tax=root TaxID=1 RepID=A0A9C9NH15_9HYPH|nr:MULTISPECIES: cupredoxin family protein [unclassified Aurantimonas]MEC5289899.1 cupredoxin family protein [Aurantimonas sp. C2-3-R2]MEC5379960.1 cupredoxin family protein [Aurantimonas sp. C2-6-R+9]MEC5410981.1 cupredoxin family protein [Aurantimonas sp. C2-4-R8]HDZ71654.1 copper oxidase [Aurantimonas coralicida]HEU01195.1 copper oxidase [Aurantimonas coralicida]